MDYVRLGGSGLQVSRVSLGAMGFGDRKWRSWNLELDQAKPLVKRALDHGINLIDTCNFYSAGASEELIGTLLKGTISRDDIVIATKFGYTMGKSPNHRGYSRKHIFEAADASLRRLGTDRIDLYQTHIWDPSANIEEMVEALADLVRAGKVLYVGATDIPAWQLAKAVYVAKMAGIPAFSTLQYHYNLIWREAEREAMPFCHDQNLGLIAYSPIARGFLSGLGRYENGGATERARTDSYAREWFGRDADFAAVDIVQSIADERGISASQVATAWVLQQPRVSSVLFGATRIEHIDEAVSALEVRLTAEEINRLNASYKPRAALAHA